jgi:hypothetical protein
MLREVFCLDKCVVHGEETVVDPRRRQTPDARRQKDARRQTPDARKTPDARRQKKALDAKRADPGSRTGC